MLRLCRNHSAFNSHNFPRTMVLMVHATTFQPYCSHRDLTRRSSLVRKLPASDCCTRGPLSCRLFPLALQPGLFRCRFSSWFCTTLSDYSPPFLPLCIQYIQPTCRDCTLHVPRRLRKVRDSNPRAISDSLVSSEVLSSTQPTFLVPAASPAGLHIFITFNF